MAEDNREHVDAHDETAEEGVSTRDALVTAGVAAAVGAVGVGVYLATREPAVAAELISHYRQGDLPERRPEDGLWRSIPAFHVELQRQQIATPNLAKQSIEHVDVRSVHNGRRVVFHIEWSDPERDEREAIDRFRDAVALQLPVDDKAAVVAFMGSPGLPVNIFHWKASWQKDVDDGFQSVKDSYPNLFEDVTPERLLKKDAVQFYPGRVAGNILSAQRRLSPVEEIVAEGFGSATTREVQKALGKGVYRDRKWRVTIAFDMDRGPGAASIKPGTRKKVAFAAWSGHRKEVGARKQWADWQLMEVRKVSG